MESKTPLTFDSIYNIKTIKNCKKFNINPNDFTDIKELRKQILKQYMKNYKNDDTKIEPEKLTKKMKSTIEKYNIDISKFTKKSGLLYLGFSIVFVFGLVNLAFGQMTLADCAKQFEENNLQLLAQRYNIESSKALAIQAKIWENPVLKGELNMVNPKPNRYFDVCTAGQKAFEIDQLIYLGGKKKKESLWALKNVELAELEFSSLLANLKFQLCSSFYDLYFSL
jgi:hypothetical protein